MDRVLRSGHKASVLRLYLSRLYPGGPRPYHSRVARCLFDDAVQQGGGQVFACSNGDLVLMAGPDTVAALGGLLLRLFRREAAGDRQLVALWSLPGDEAAVRLEFAAGPGDVPIADEPPAPLGAMAAVGTLLAATPYRDFVRRQRAVRIVGGRMTDLFHELNVSLSDIESRIGMAIPLGTDPYLFRYIAAQLERGLLDVMGEARLAHLPAVHINAPVRFASSPGFKAIRQAAREAGTLLGVEIDLAEAIANFGRFATTQDWLRQEGCTVVVDGVTFQTLEHCNPARFSADLLKLKWCPSIPSLPHREQRAIRRSLNLFGVDRIVIDAADTEAALVWGRAQGIACFQGRHVDLMLAAERIRACDFSSACVMRQCIDRGAAVNEQGQAGCLNPALLVGGLQTRSELDTRRPSIRAAA